MLILWFRSSSVGSHELKKTGAIKQKPDCIKFNTFLNPQFLRLLSSLDSNVLTLLRLAEEFEVTRLKSKCERFLLKNKRNYHPLDLIQTAYCYNLTNVLKCGIRMASRMPKVEDCDDFNAIDASIRERITRQKRSRSRPKDTCDCKGFADTCISEVDLGDTGSCIIEQEHQQRSFPETVVADNCNKDQDADLFVSYPGDLTSSSIFTDVYIKRSDAHVNEADVDVRNSCINKKIHQHKRSRSKKLITDVYSRQTDSQRNESDLDFCDTYISQSAGRQENYSWKLLTDVYSTQTELQINETGVDYRDTAKDESSRRQESYSWKFATDFCNVIKDTHTRTTEWVDYQDSQLKQHIHHQQQSNPGTTVVTDILSEACVTVPESDCGIDSSDDPCSLSDDDEDYYADSEDGFENESPLGSPNRTLGTENKFHVKSVRNPRKLFRKVFAGIIKMIKD